MVDRWLTYVQLAAGGTAERNGSTRMTYTPDPSPRRERSLFNEQWEKMDPGPIAGREPELAALVETLSPPGSVVEVVAQPGMGKTSLLKIAAERYRQQFGGAVEYVVGGQG